MAIEITSKGINIVIRAASSLQTFQVGANSGILYKNMHYTSTMKRNEPTLEIL